MITRYSHSFFFSLLYTDHLKETIQHTTSHQSIKSLQYSSVTSTTNDDEIVPSTPYTMTDSHNIESTFISSESPDIISSITTTTTVYPNIGSSKYSRDPAYITSSNIDIISSTKSYVDHPGLTTVNSYVSLDVVSQYQSRTPKYIIFLATISTCLLFIGITMTLVKVIIKRRLRRGGALRRTSRRPIVRDLGSLQMTCVVNESNVEGIEMQER